jgi:hypothetical protein
MLCGRRFNGRFGVAIAAGEVGLKRGGNRVHIAQGKTCTFGDFAGFGFQIVERSHDYAR